MSRTALAIAGLVSLLGAVTQGQLSHSAPSRAVIQQSMALPAIDRGLRDKDLPRRARTSADAARVRVDRTVASDFVNGSVIVKFKGDTDPFDLVEIPAGADPEAAAAVWRARADVEFAQPRYKNYAMSRPNDTLYPNQWNFPAIDMERAWDIQPGASSDIIVAVLDSGMAFKSGMIRYNAGPFTLDGRRYPALGIVDVPFAVAPELGTDGSPRFVAPRDFIWNDDLPVDLDGHGTHVAGTIGQLTNNNNGVAGMAYNVRLMPVKIIQSLWDEIFGSPFEGTDDVVARGIRYAADNGAKILNLSIGRSEGGPAPAVTEAIRYAVGRGCFVVVASGNTRDTGNPPNRLAQSANEIDGMVAVGAVGRTLDAAYYSTTGSYVEIAAPGGDQRQGGMNAGILQQTLDLDLLETYDRPMALFGPPRADSFGYYYFQGTSMATPHVSGFAALLMQQGITNPAVIEAAMKQFATDKGAAGRDDVYGYGLINPRATLRGLGLAR